MNRTLTFLAQASTADRPIHPPTSVLQNMWRKFAHTRFKSRVTGRSSTWHDLAGAVQKKGWGLAPTVFELFLRRRRRGRKRWRLTAVRPAVRATPHRPFNVRWGYT